MPLVHDIIFGNPADRDKVFKSAKHLKSYRSVANAGFSIDDVVTLLSIHRQVAHDRKHRFSLRREVYYSYKEDDKDVNCHIAVLSSEIRDEVAGISDAEISGLMDEWPPTSVPIKSPLRTFMHACRDARDDSLAIMVKTYDAGNAFQLAITKLPRKERDHFRSAFDSWDKTAQRQAHDKYKYLQLIGQGDCLAIVREEIEHGHSYCATLSFLTAIRRTVEDVVRGGVDGIDYLDQLKPAVATALARFRAGLDENDQRRVLQAFSISLMSALLGVVEDGYAFGVPSGPTGWALIETDGNGNTTGSELGELHAFLDGSDEFWPNVESVARLPNRDTFAATPLANQLYGSASDLTPLETRARSGAV
jgi:hypothetical protein